MDESTLFRMGESGVINKMELIFQTNQNDRIYRDGHVVYLYFGGQRDVLSTAASNGGYQKDLTVLFNYDCCHDGTVEATMKAETLEEHMEILAKEFGLDPKKAAGGSTAVPMKCLAVESEIYGEVQVTAVVTAGLQGNGGRVGDPASYEEKDGEFVMLPNGTIHIYLLVDARLSEDTMARAMVTATEAKTAAIQELMIRSRYSMGLATGSGTDKMFIVANPGAAQELTDAGKHSKLGEMIGSTVKKATKQSLLSKLRDDEKSPLYPLKNFGWQEQTLPEVDGMESAIYMFTHLLDLLMWEKLSFAEVAAGSERLFAAYDLDMDALTACIEKGKDLMPEDQVRMLAACFRRK